MSPSQHLYHLIQSLNRAEKTYFREFAKRRNKTGAVSFLRLFDLIERTTDYNEERLAAEVGVSSFPSLKVRLFDLIIEALQERESYDNKPSEIASYLQQIEILHKKGLKGPLWKRIAKLEEMCSDVEDFQTWKLVLQKRQAIALEEIEPGCIPPQMEGFFELYATVKQKAANLEAYKDLEDIVHFERCKGANALHQTALALQVNPLLGDEAVRMSVRSEIKFLELKRSMSRWTNQMQLALGYAQAIVTLLEGAPQLLQDTQLQLLYIKQISNIGLYHAATGAFEKAIQGIDRLNAMQDFPHHVFERVHAIELRLAMQKLDLNEGKAIIAQITTGLVTHDHKISQERKAAYSYLIAHFLLSFGESREALKWVLRLRIVERPGINKALKDFAEILFLLCHFDLKNFDVIKEEAKKLKEYLKKRCALSKYEEAVINGLLQAAKSKNELARKQQLELLGQALNDILGADAQRFKENFFPIQSWVSAKLSAKLPVEIEFASPDRFK